MSLVPRQRVPDSVVPFVHVLQRHGCVVLDNLGQGGALVEDHAKDDKLQVCSERWIPVDCAGDFFFFCVNCNSSPDNVDQREDVLANSVHTMEVDDGVV